ncbi:RNA polymerase I-specific transcription initiation factor RRN3 [Auriscalpium vulgare]|uniref:RNA polymerase I-specific transcription initiation factor RRN3 n=1 Tax=Auriscalpium vulgare TaxID=40419 RepID=A0ACB8S9A6_9AGAM|nr:RNA polymerase I-specific transcription initiation factor RRN3 [Auriscalpium vulgare]
MDPHSRLSQFNQRPPRAGPAPRHMDVMGLTSKLPSLDSAKKASRKSSPAMGTPRVISSNSRVRQDERLRKDMHLAFVNNALQQKALGSSEAYDELVDQFALKKTVGDAPSPTPQLRLWIEALMHVVSRLDRSHASLVDAILRMPWMTMDSSFVKTYTSFVLILVSARPEYLSPVLGKLAQGFTYQSGIQALDAGLPESSSAPLTRRVVYERLHYLLRHLLALIPTLPSTLQPLLAQHFPHKRQTLASQVTYIRNMLQITEYCPEIADRLLSTIVDRAIQIDVEIQVELEELEAVGPAQEQAELFDLDLFDTLIGQEGDGDSEDSEEDDGGGLSDLSSDAEGLDDEDLKTPDAPLDVDHISDMVSKLDAILKLVFEHLRRTHNAPTASVAPPIQPASPPPPVLTDTDFKSIQRTQFHTLLSIFDRTILRTFKSRYTQFLVFWFASLDAEFSDTFEGMLISKALLEPAQPVVTRAAAASYIASFVSRAAFVDRTSARNVVRVLCRFLRRQLELFEAPHALRSDPEQAPPTVFYAVAQAVFLVFCFRWRDLMEEQDEDEFSASLLHRTGKKWMDELSIVQRIVTCALNPLKVCSENVVLQFARVAQATGFVYIYPLLEANRRLEFATSTPSTPHAHAPVPHAALFGDRVISELNTFFPFDPYKLPRSAAYIEGIYREWAAVAIGEDDDDEDEDYAESDGEEEGKVEHHGASAIGRGRTVSVSVSDDGLGASFGGMSISPAAPGLRPIVV